ncbi:SusD/RagB family nutrient-binding outer membrane lipoprotein [Limibacter armeniacum]|uniref:SusD/RagB family nutrient-binding outer membrane lipoprotein n=1 Tax=Limibacter armeniacum TaxID=466084 RepID=UPI002FE52E06
MEYNTLIKRYIGILLSLLLSMTACDSILGDNEDPLATTDDQIKERPEALFVGVLTSLSSDRVLGTNVFNRWSQHYVGASFSDEDNFNVPDFPQSVTWPVYYASVIKNTILGERAAASVNRRNVQAQYEIMRAYAFYHLTLMFEQVPFSEVMDFDGEDLNTRYPHYENQQEIFEGVIETLDAAMSRINTNDTDAIKEEDLLYNGNMVRWMQFANSLKIKTLMLLSGKDDSYHAALEAAFGQSYIDAIEEEAIFHYGSTLANANQFYKLHKQFADGQSQFFFASEPFVDMLLSQVDPRLWVFYDYGTDATSVIHTGMEPGSTAAFTITSVLSLNYISATSPDLWLTASEMYLLHAEAMLKGWINGDATQAHELYLEGIRMNFNRINSLEAVINNGETVGESRINSYLEDVPVLNFLSNDRAINAVYYQAYVERFNRGLDAWTFVRRTGFPDRPLPVNSALSDHITRLPYPADERSSNENIPEQPLLDDLMWFMPIE